MKISYHFKSSALIALALTHKSAASPHNERLEFLGDTLLNFFVSEALFLKFPEADEGLLSRLRASLVNQETLAELARTLDLGSALNLGSGEIKSGGREKDSLLADALEAVIAAIYLDSNMETCREVVLGWLADKLSRLSLDVGYKDAKSTLQEWLQARSLALPDYRLVDQVGPDNNRIFTVSCSVQEPDLTVNATGKSKKQAEQAAAEMVLLQLEGQRYDG